MQQFLIGLSIVGLTFAAIAVSDRLIFGRWRLYENGSVFGLAGGTEEIAVALLLVGAVFALLFFAFRYLIRSTLEVFDWCVARVHARSERNKNRRVG